MWILQKGGCSSSGRYCVQAGSLWRSSWGASPANPSLYLLYFSGCPPHLSSRILCDAEEVNSSSPSELLCCAAPPSGRHDCEREVWICHFSSRPSLLFPSSNPRAALVLACSPSRSRRCNRAGSPVWEERRLCGHGCCGGDLLQSGSCSHWTGWIFWDHLWLRLRLQAPCVRKSWVHAG